MAGLAVEHADDQVGVDFHSREGIGKRRDPQVGQPGSGRTQQDDAVLQLFGASAPTQNVDRGNIGKRRSGPVRHVHRTVQTQRHADAADVDPWLGIVAAEYGNGGHASGRQLAAERHPQGRGRQREVVAITEMLDQAHLPRRAVGIGEHVEVARGGCRTLEDFEVGTIAGGFCWPRPQLAKGVRRQNGGWQGSRPILAHAGRNEVIAERNRTFCQSLGEARVVIQLRLELFEAGEKIPLPRQFSRGETLQGIESGTVVRLGKHHVETDRGNAIVIEQTIHQGDHPVAAPGPTTDFLQAAFVDVEHRDPVVDTAHRRLLQPGVVPERLGALHHRQMQRPRNMQRHQNDKGCRKGSLSQGRVGGALHRMR